MSKPSDAATSSIGHRTSAIYILFTTLVLAIPLASFCQTTITPDGSLGTTVNQVGNVFNIDGGTIKGTNQFQSFGKFSLGSTDTASFNGPVGIENILSRVTGGELSNINGTMRSTINGANLYFFNPSGVVFGPDAKLDVSGSFHVSTADFVRFADGARFFADLSKDSVLTAAPPEAFGFLNSNPAGIALQDSVLQVPEGQTLSVIGGDIEMKGGALVAPSSRINLVSAASPGEAIPTASDPALTSEQWGTVDISGHASIDASGIPFTPDGRGGTVLIRAGQLMFDSSSMLADTRGNINGAEIGIDMKVTDEAAITGGAVISSGTSLFNTGDAGAVVLDVGRLTVTGDSAIESSTSVLSTGKAGDITITAREGVSIIDANVRSQSIASFGDGGQISITAPEVTLQGGNGNTINSGTTFLSGNGGDIVLNVNRLVLTDHSAIISTTEDGSGKGGNILVRATEEVAISSETSFFESAVRTRNGRSSGPAGNITVETKQLSLTGGGQIDSSTQGTGSAGNILITASEQVLIAGRNAGGTPSSVSSKNELGGVGNAGNIVIRTDQLTLTDSGRVESSTQSIGKGGSIVVEGLDTSGTPTGEVLISGFIVMGAPDDLSMPADEVLTSQLDTGLFTDTTAEGRGGEIRITANKVILTDNGIVSAKATATGDAGNLTIAAGTFRSDNSSLTTEAEMSDGGNIELTAGPLVDLFKSTITAEANGPTQSGSDGGNVSILGNNVSLNRSAVLANAFGGDGGNIDIVAKVFLASTDSIIDASSELGIDGEVNVDAGVRVLTGTLAPLPDVFLSGVDLLRERCEARYRKGRSSSFTVGGRDRVPLEPRDLLPSPHYRKNRARPGSHEPSRNRAQITMAFASGDTVLASDLHGFSLWPECLR